MNLGFQDLILILVTLFYSINGNYLVWCRLQENLLLLPVGSRSLTVIALELLLSGNDFPNSIVLFLIDRVFLTLIAIFFFESTVKSGSTKRALSFWSASYLSSDLFVKLLKTSRYNNFFYDCFYCMNFCIWCLIPMCLLFLADWFEVPEPCCPCTPGGCWGLSRGSVWGHQLVCYSCQESHHHA